MAGCHKTAIPADCRLISVGAGGNGDMWLSPFRVPKLMQLPIEIGLKPIAAQGLQCLEHQVDAREEEQADSDDRQERGQGVLASFEAWRRAPE